ncbi:MULTISPECIES: hypothetical protein [Curtobacterium]|uniref:hypothetical protein n=1 Tax=Curtobacterium TaxID=2034 RepID=UPI001129ACA0|nr:hypothetical protein [Curtobacterium flaccumfaciens]MBT1620139.1 hypothetical protein [Curtobacterium flaccumfaciens pv. poinsettiae]
MTRHRADRALNAPTTAAARARARAVVRFVVGIGVIIVTVVAGLIALAALRSYDLGHRVTLRCHVTSAEGITRGSSNRGIGGQDARVVITTEDCGKLVLWKGVTRTNNRTTAGRIDTSAEHAVEVGAGTWEVRGLLHAIGRSPSAFGVAPTS